MQSASSYHHVTPLEGGEYFSLLLLLFLLGSNQQKVKNGEH
jgi:hypothetical protein